MSKIFILECSFNLKWEIVVHFKHSKTNFILVVSGSEAPSYNTPGSCRDFLHVPAAPLYEIGVVDTAREHKTCECSKVSILTV